MLTSRRLYPSLIGFIYPTSFATHLPHARGQLPTIRGGSLQPLRPRSVPQTEPDSTLGQRRPGTLTSDTNFAIRNSNQVRHLSMIFFQNLERDWPAHALLFHVPLTVEYSVVSRTVYIKPLVAAPCEPPSANQSLLNRQSTDATLRLAALRSTQKSARLSLAKDGRTDTTGSGSVAPLRMRRSQACILDLFRAFQTTR